MQELNLKWDESISSYRAKRNLFFCPIILSALGLIGRPTKIKLLFSTRPIEGGKRISIYQRHGWWRYSYQRLDGQSLDGQSLAQHGNFDEFSQGWFDTNPLFSVSKGTSISTPIYIKVGEKAKKIPSISFTTPTFTWDERIIRYVDLKSKICFCSDLEKALKFSRKEKVSFRFSTKKPVGSAVRTIWLGYSGGWLFYSVVPSKDVSKRTGILSQDVIKFLHTKPKAYAYFLDNPQSMTKFYAQIRS